MFNPFKNSNFENSFLDKKEKELEKKQEDLELQISNFQEEKKKFQEEIVLKDKRETSLLKIIEETTLEKLTETHKLQNKIDELLDENKQLHQKIKSISPSSLSPSAPPLSTSYARKRGVVDIRKLENCKCDKIYNGVVLSCSFDNKGNVFLLNWLGNKVTIVSKTGKFISDIDIPTLESLDINVNDEIIGVLSNYNLVLMDMKGNIKWKVDTQPFLGACFSSEGNIENHTAVHLFHFRVRQIEFTHYLKNLFV